jgi:hypothetical protein
MRTVVVIATGSTILNIGVALLTPIDRQPINLAAQLAEIHSRTASPTHVRTRRSAETGNKEESVIARQAIARNKLRDVIGRIPEDASRLARVIVAPVATATPAAQRPPTRGQVAEEEAEEETVSETEAFPAAVDLATPAPSAEAAGPVEAPPAAAALVARPAWEDPVAVAEDPVAVAEDDADNSMNSHWRNI